MFIMSLNWRNTIDKIRKLQHIYSSKRSVISKALPANMIKTSWTQWLTRAQSNPTMNNKLLNIRQRYEEFTGLDEVRDAQNRVLEAELKFVASQEQRRAANSTVIVLQNRLREIYAELDKVKRGEERYVFLVTQEHQLLKEEKNTSGEFQRLEREERENFTILSSALKDSHERERMYVERTKYWSIIASITAAVIGLFGGMINTELRMRRLRGLISDALAIKDIDPSIQTNLDEILTKLNSALLKKESIYIPSPISNNNSSKIEQILLEQQQHQRNVYFGFAAVTGVLLLLLGFK